MKTTTDPFSRLAAAVRHTAEESAKRHSRTTFRGEVTAVDPLTVDLRGSDAVLYEDDEDVDVAQIVRDHAPEVGDLLIVHREASGDWIVTGVVERGSLDPWTEIP